ncbi:hypothetical protein [Rariglobus hedericola]|uniref:Uncharacterized protein n=1 Tax=Rariglobus hedericola TaxID=2597822 RepID=A0A556QK33_9BACT|nr:hypothetical protein [Rariglobus hedericola]TSJ77015.1 hypothetical protein FPL22_12965 [Rariglobus hedericola]
MAVTSNLPSCPLCKRTIPAEDFNVSTDLAYCRSCNQAHSLIALMENARLDALLEEPVPGTWKHQNMQGDVVLGASHRSLKMAAGLLAVALFWNGIVSVFVAIATASTLKLSGITLPDSFPEFKNEGGPMGWGFTIFLWCFLTPFIAVGTWMIISFLMSLAGKTVVTIGSGKGKIFTGVGPFGRTKRFNPADVKSISVRAKFVADSDGGGHQDEKIYIELHNGEELTFGGSLPKKRKYQLAARLREATGLGAS